MPDIRSMIKAIKLNWIKILIEKDNNFTALAHENSKVKSFDLYFDHKHTFEHLLSIPTPFYKQILEIWDEIRSIDKTKTINDILNEKIWLNKAILIEHLPFLMTNWNEWGIKTLKDILRPDFSFKTLNELNIKFGSTCKILTGNIFLSYLILLHVKHLYEVYNIRQ